MHSFASVELEHALSQKELQLSSFHIRAMVAVLFALFSLKVFSPVPHSNTSRKTAGLPAHQEGSFQAKSLPGHSVYYCHYTTGSIHLAEIYALTKP